MCAREINEKPLARFPVIPVIRRFAVNSANIRPECRQRRHRVNVFAKRGFLTPLVPKSTEKQSRFLSRHSRLYAGTRHRTTRQRDMRYAVAPKIGPRRLIQRKCASTCGAFGFLEFPLWSGIAASAPTLWSSETAQSRGVICTSCQSGRQLARLLLPTSAKATL